MSSANRRHANMKEHELVDMSFVARELNLQKRQRGPRRKTSSLPIHKGVCGFQDCPVLSRNYVGALVQRPTTYCQSCLGGKGSYYHLPCFFKVHRCMRDW